MSRLRKRSASTIGGGVYDMTVANPPHNVEESSCNSQHPPPSYPRDCCSPVNLQYTPPPSICMKCQTKNKPYYRIFSKRYSKHTNQNIHSICSVVRQRLQKPSRYWVISNKNVFHHEEESQPMSATNKSNSFGVHFFNIFSFPQYKATVM